MYRQLAVPRHELVFQLFVGAAFYSHRGLVAGPRRRMMHVHRRHLLSLTAASLISISFITAGSHVCQHLITDSRTLVSDEAS